MEKMNFDEFQNWVAEKIKVVLPEEYENAKVELTKLVKTGETYMGMTVKRAGQNVAPAINMNEYYRMYMHGRNENDLLREIAKVVDTELQYYNPEIITSYPEVKKNLFVRLCNAEKNEEFLNMVPHTRIADLAMTYHVKLEFQENSLASTVVTNELLASYGITKEQLQDDAMENSVRIMPAKLDTMKNILSSFEDYPAAEGKEMLVISNEANLNGASALMYPGIMNEISEKLGGNFFVLPSSIHEQIAVPAASIDDYRNLESTVRSVNAYIVDPKDQLSDHVYHYDAVEKKFELASTYEERMAAKAQDHTKASIRGKLASAMKDASVMNADKPDKAVKQELAL